MSNTSALLTPRQLIPDPSFAEYHQRRLDIAPDEASRALHAVTFRDVRLLGPLMAVRTLPARLTGAATWAGGDRRLEEVFAVGFDILDRGPDGYLFAGVEQPFKLQFGERRPMGSAEEFKAFGEPGFCRIVGDFRVTVRDGATVVSTETVVDCTDAATRRAFARYWRLIRPFSGLIRHSMMAAVRRRADLDSRR
jgi:hypothetical protein